jgi:hypothetical protein
MRGRVGIVGLAMVLGMVATGFTGQIGKQTEAEIAGAVRTMLDGLSIGLVRSLNSGRKLEFRLGERAANLQELEASASILAVSPGEAALGHRLRGLLHLAQLQYDQADASLGMSINAAPTAHAHYMRGFIRIALGQRDAGVADLNACLGLKPAPPLRAECQTTLEHTKRNPTGETWTSFRDDRAGVGFAHPADWSVLSGRTSQVLDHLFAAGLPREAANQFANAFRTAVGAYMIVNPYDGAAMTIEIRDLGKAARRDVAVKSWSAAVENKVQFERQNVALYPGIRVRSNTLSQSTARVRVDFRFGFELPIFEKQIPVSGWRTMMFFDKAPSRTVRIEHACSEALSSSRDAVWARFADSIELWVPR